MKHSRINLFLILFFSCFLSYAQNTYSLSGSILEKSSKEPLEFVTIALFRSTDSALVNSVYTAKNGAYTINNIPAGNYYLKTYFIGFKDTCTALFNISKEKENLTMEPLVIRAMNHVLGEVEITAEKELYQASLDRKIYNVEKDLQSKSGSASDVLQNVPSVAVDIDGAVSLRGSSNITIFINGKPSPLMKVSAAAALQAIPANTIERIEIITNPSAKYRSDGSAGIINLVLKKNNKSGFNGTLTANAGNDERCNSTISLNYKPSKLNLSGTYGFRQDYRNKKASDNRIQYDSSGSIVNVYKQTTNNEGRPLSHTAELKADYAPDKSNDLGLSFSLFQKKVTKKDHALTLLTNADDLVLDDFDRNNTDPELENEKELSFNYEHRFKKEDHTFNFELTLADLYEMEQNHFTETHRSPSFLSGRQNIFNKDAMRQAQANADYTLPINENSELQAGYYMELVHQDLDFFGETYLANTDSWNTNKAVTNRFLFEQQIHAAYLTYSQNIGDFTLMGGLRAEQAHLKSNLLTLDSVVPQDYFKLYPSLHAAYEISDKQKVQLSYSKRVNRPEGDQLNPFPEYKNTRNIDAGNPYLQPEQIHSFELGYQGSGNTVSFFPTLYYRYTSGAFTEISRYINDTVFLTSHANISNNQSTGLEMVLSGKIKKILNLNLSGNAYYNQIDASNLGYANIRSAFLWTTKLAANANITNTMVVQVNTSYVSAQLTPQGKTLPVFVFNAGMSCDLFKKKAALLLTVSDVFNTLRSQSEINSPVLYQKTLNKRKSQIVYLGFTWRFGHTSKPVKESMKFDEKL